MNRENIKLHQPSLTSEEISQRRDFSKVMNKYNATKPSNSSPWRMRTIIIGLSAVIILLAIRLITIDNSKENIPKQSEEVKLQNKEAVSNVPTVTTIDESSDLNLKVRKQPVTTNDDVNRDINNDGKNINVQQQEKISTVKSINADSIRKQEEERRLKIDLLKKEIIRLEAEIKKLEAQAPLKPVKANNYTFKIDIVPSQFPELSKYKDVLFEVVEGDPEFSPDVMKVEWETIKLLKDKNDYRVYLTKGKKKKSFKVRPVFTGKAYSKAMKEYDGYEENLNNLKKIKETSEKEFDELTHL